RSVESEWNAGLIPEVSMKGPSTDDAVDDTIGAAHKRLAFTKRQFINEVSLETMSDVERREALLQTQISEGRRLVKHRRAARERVREALAKGVAALDQQTLRHASTEFKRQSVVPALTVVIYGERIGEHARVHIEHVIREEPEPSATCH